MSFADDQLYNGYVRRNLPKLVTKVKVREILPHLPCLTAHDRETIETKREMISNQDAVVHLLDCLKRRDNWPDEFIQALEKCEHRAIAAEIQTEYNKLKYPRPVSPKTTSPNSPANHFPVSETEFKYQAAFAPSAPSAPAVASSWPAETSTHRGIPQQATFHVPEMVAPSTPALRSPEAHQPPPAAAEEIRIHQEPEENSFIQTSGLTPDRATRDDSVNSDRSPQVARLDISEDAASNKSPVTPPRSSNPNQIVTPPPANVPKEVSFRIRTPEKPPVQDTTPPVEAAAHHRVQPSQPPAEKERGKRSSAAKTTATQRGPADEVSTCADPSVCLSKPTQLCSIQAPEQVHPSPDSVEEPPFSNLVSLQISEDVQRTATCGPVDSPSQSLQEIVVQVSEEPWRLNMAGQSSLKHRPNVRDAEMCSSSIMAAAEGKPSATSSSKPHEKIPSGSLAAHGKYLVVAAGVAVCALLVVWRVKHK
ncbi:mitochondrial antiviral-signaling protein [Neosynchiropus ocellatus]